MVQAGFEDEIRQRLIDKLDEIYRYSSHMRYYVDSRNMTGEDSVLPEPYNSPSSRARRLSPLPLPTTIPPPLLPIPREPEAQDTSDESSSEELLDGRSCLQIKQCITKRYTRITGRPLEFRSNSEDEK